MSLTAFRTEAFRFAHPVPPRRSSGGGAASPRREYFWIRSSRSTGTRSFASPA